MNFHDAALLLAVMITLAAVPSSSVALVVARGAAQGIPGGLAATAGIVAGDLGFVLLAVLGLATLAETLDSAFAVLRFIAAAYLVWLGTSLFRDSGDSPSLTQTRPGMGLPASFLAGLLLTLGDVKAIFFYASLFPAFVDLSALGRGDIAIIVLITVVAVGGVKAVYVVTAHRIVAVADGSAFKPWLGRIAGTLLVTIGVYLAASTAVQ